MPFGISAADRALSRVSPAAESCQRRPALLVAWLLLVLWLVAVWGCEERGVPRLPDQASLRNITAGELIGFTGQYGGHVWLGIPYAKPPVGDLRWRAPQAASPWKGMKEALKFGSSCPQLASRFAGIADLKPGTPAGSEDCLYLNIYAPRFSADEVPRGDKRLPVMVWIHGGGNSIGLGDFYNGGNLAVTHDVIVVTTNYRLGPLGWFRHAALRNDGASDEERSGNFGTLDLIAALQWVRDNIEGFGGDPGNVTIFGESAGARNVISLLLSPPAAGLFHRAIAQSGSTYTQDAKAAENFTDDAEPGHGGSSNEVLARLLVGDGTARDREAAKRHIAGMKLDEIGRYFRSKSPVELLSAYSTERNESLIDFPNVFADGVVLPREKPLERFNRANGYNQVPVIFGTNRDENKLFMFASPRWIRTFLWVFRRLRDEALYNAASDALAGIWKISGADAPAAAMRQVQGPSVYVYRWDWDEEPSILGADLSVMLGAAHGFEIPFVFGHFDLGAEANRIFTQENEPGRRELAQKMMSYWAHFAYTGNPGRGRQGELPQWMSWSPGSTEASKFMVFDTEADGGLRMSSKTITKDSVLASVESDPRLKTQRQRCSVYRELALWSHLFTPEEYASAGRQGCAEYPLEEDAFGR